MPRSETAVLREHFIRRGTHLTHISVIDDRPKGGREDGQLVASTRVAEGVFRQLRQA